MINHSHDVLQRNGNLLSTESLKKLGAAGALGAVITFGGLHSSDIVSGVSSGIESIGSAYADAHDALAEEMLTTADQNGTFDK